MFAITDLHVCFRWVKRKKYGVGDKEQNREHNHGFNSPYLDYDYTKAGRNSSSATSTAVTFTEVEMEFSETNFTVQSLH